jgi:hypothetical protein
MHLDASSEEDVRKNILIAGIGTSFFSLFSAFLAILTHSWMVRRPDTHKRTHPVHSFPLDFLIDGVVDKKCAIIPRVGAVL